MKPIITLLCCAIVLQLYAQQWTTAELSQARWHPSMVANGHVLVVGGGCFDYEETFSDRVDIYNALTGIWTQATLSAPRYTAGIAAAGDKVIFGGGVSHDPETGDHIFLNTVDIYDINTQQWTTDTFPAGPRFFIRGIGVGNKAYFMGGRPDIQTLTSTVQIYDTETSTWSMGTDIPFPSGTASIARFGNKIMLKRGTVWGIYDTEANTWGWENFPSPTPAEQSPVVTPTEIWLIGGYSVGDNAPSNRILIYNIANGTWSEKTLAVSRMELMAAYIAGKIIVAGGFTFDLSPPFPPTDIVEIYDTQTGEWNIEFTLFEKRGVMDYQGTAPVIGNQVFFPGGVPTGDGISTRVDIYTNTGTSGTFLPKLPATSFQLSPQPCRDFVNISFDLNIKEAAWLTVCDMHGRPVFTQRLPAGDIPDLTLNTSQWLQGGYVIALSSNQGVLAKRLVKVD
jgi:hypothetical protein